MISEELLGWITPHLILHDQSAPGLIQRVLGASNQNRHAIFAAFADIEHRLREDGGELSPNPKLSILMRDGRARDILQAIYGNVPNGLLGALDRSGSQVLNPATYRRLFDLFKGPEKRRAACLRYIGSITDDRVEAVITLRAELLSSMVLLQVQDGRAATALNQTMDFLRQVNSAVTDKAISEAVRQITTEHGLKALINRFIRRADRLPPQPMTQDGDLQPIDTIPALLFAARKYRNCLCNFVPRVLAGVAAFAEYQDRLILEFHPLSDGSWLLASINGPSNGFVAAEDEAEARAYCAELGIQHVIEKAQMPAGWNSASRFAPRWGWGFD